MYFFSVGLHTRIEEAWDEVDENRDKGDKESREGRTLFVRKGAENSNKKKSNGKGVKQEVYGRSKRKELIVQEALRITKKM